MVHLSTWDISSAEPASSPAAGCVDHWHREVRVRILTKLQYGTLLAVYIYICTPLVVILNHCQLDVQRKHCTLLAVGGLLFMKWNVAAMWAVNHAFSLTLWGYTYFYFMYVNVKDVVSSAAEDRLSSPTSSIKLSSLLQKDQVFSAARLGNFHQRIQTQQHCVLSTFCCR